MTEAEAQRRAIREYYYNTFTHGHCDACGQNGKAVLQDMKQSYNDRSSFYPGEPHTTVYHEGQRSVYLSIISIIEEVKTRGFSEPTVITKEE